MTDDRAGEGSAAGGPARKNSAAEPHARPALSRLLSITPDTFAREHWGRSPVFSRAGELDGGSQLGFDDLFSEHAVDELVTDRGIRTPFVRMAREGSVLPAADFTSPGGYGAEIGDQLDSSKVLAEFAAGSTIVLQGLHRTWAPLATFVRRLVHDIGHPCQVNAYVTPASSRGFDPHYDVHDVFVVQIAGKKHWTIHEPVQVDPLATQPWTDHRAAVADRAARAPAIDETLRPGDVLYLPRGWIHSATALGTTSVHLTIGVAAITRHDVLQQLVAGLAGDPALRASLPLGAGSADTADLAATIESVIADAAARFTPADSATPSTAPSTTAASTTAPTTARSTADFELVAATAAGLQRRVRRSSRPEPVRPLATTAALESLAPDSVVQWRSGLPVRVAATSESVSIGLERTTVTLPSLATAAVTALADGAALRIADLPALDPDSALVVARRLVREGAVMVRDR